MRRGIYLSVFVVLSIIAGGVYYNHTRLEAAVVATHDLNVGTRIQQGDVSLRSVNPSSVAGQLLQSPDQAVGKVVSSPILQDQFVDARQLMPIRNVAMLAAGLPVPAGDRIIGLPVTPAAAVGGAIKPGDLVDVLAIPNPAKGASLIDAPTSPPVILGKDVMVIGVRSEDGTPIAAGDPTPNSGSSRPASVLLAIPASDEISYSAAIASSSFVLTLSTD